MRPEAEPEKNLRGAKMKEMDRYNTFKNSIPLKYLLLLWLKQEYIKKFQIIGVAPARDVSGTDVVNLFPDSGYCWLRYSCAKLISRFWLLLVLLFISLS